MLYDIDRNGDDRSSPSPNSHDVVAQEAVMAKNTNSTAYKSIGQLSNTTRIRLANSTILFYDDQNRVISVYGFIPNLAAYPVQITAKYGYDVYTDILGLPAPS